ncbi:MAG: calcium/sodium antiporter [Bacteroidales bacterium]|nr:calcium/sodium antiporter [Candidatus Cryptobacteroides aphodequi]
MDIILLLAGLALVVFGSDWLVDGASAIARKAHISEFVIGLTIVGFGTSCPELVVSLTGALQGNADVSLGNVVGSNVFNTLLILGVTGLISPLVITRTNSRRDLPIMLGVTLFFILISLKGEINFVDGIVMLLVFAAYMFICFKYDKQETCAEEESAQKKDLPLLVAILLTLAGFAGLVFGGRLFVDNAVSLAHRIGVSDKVIAVTLLAGGTSLPELVTCIVAAVKGKCQLALGNIIGSNIFNILLILGISSLVHPLGMQGMSMYDFGVLGLSAVLLFLAPYIGRKNCLDRFDAVLLLLLEAAYGASLILV